MSGIAQQRGALRVHPREECRCGGRGSLGCPLRSRARRDALSLSSPLSPPLADDLSSLLPPSKNVSKRAGAKIAVHAGKALTLWLWASRGRPCLRLYLRLCQHLWRPCRLFRPPCPCHPWSSSAQPEPFREPPCPCHGNRRCEKEQNMSKKTEAERAASPARRNILTLCLSTRSRRPCPSLAQMQQREGSACSAKDLDEPQ